MALRHKEPDRVPFDLAGTVTTGIHRLAYRKLLDFLGIAEAEVRVGEIHQQLAAVHEDVLKRLLVDVRPVYSRLPAGWTPSFTDDEQYTRFTDQWGIGWRKPKDGGLYYDLASHPFARFSSPADVVNYKIPDPADPSRLLGMREAAEQLSKESGAALCLAGVSAGFTELAWWLRGFEDFLTDLVIHPDMACAILDKTLEIKLGFWEMALAHVGDSIDVVVEADDYAGQHGMIMSPATYRKYIKPRQRELFGRIKSYASPDHPIYIVFHSCGAIREIIPDLIEVGVDAINPVQVSAANMDTRQLKREFGDSLTFWGGGVDSQRILNYGTPEQVREEAKRRIEDLAPGGGFVFAAIHNVQPDVPPANFMAMWEAWREYGCY